jgi:hypothetical protein
MTRLRQMMLGDLQLQHYADNTVRTYIKIIKSSPTTLGNRRISSVRSTFVDVRFTCFATTNW